MPHTKPSKEELQEQIDRSLAESEALAKKVPVPEPEPSVPEPIEPPEPSIPDPELSEPPAPEPTPSPDYKTKFKESSKEGQLLFGRSKEFNKIVIEANNLPDPTEEELVTAIGDADEWEILTEFEKNQYKESFISKRYREHIAIASKPFVELEKWIEDVENFATDEANLKKYPILVGKEEKFIEYASKAQYQGSNFELLIDGFNGDLEALKVKNKGQMFPSSTGGPSEKIQPKDGKITLAQGAALMKSNFPLYKEYLRAGKIENE